MADKVAPYGLAGVVTGAAGNADDEDWKQILRETAAANRPKVTPAESGVRGALQGVTSNFGDELAAGIETAASKIPGVRSLAQLAQPDGAPRVDDPNVTYEQRRDFKRGQEAAARTDNPGTYLAGQVAGGVAQAAVPGVGALGRGATAGARLAGATASGALSGLGSSAATDVAGMAKDTAIGAGGGLLAGAAGEGVRKIVKGAPGRVEDRDFKGLGEDVRQPLKTALTDQSVRVRDVLREPGIRGALGNPGKMVAATEAGMNETGAAAGQIMTSADKAAGGGMAVKDVVAPLLTLQAEMAKNSEHPAAVAALKRVVGQFESGIGSDPSGRVPTAKVREFLTQQLQKPGFARGLQAEPPPAQQALRSAAGVLKDSIEQHVKMALTPEAAATLQRLNDRTTAYAVIQGAAQAQVDRGMQAPGPMTSIAKALMGRKAEGVGGAIGYAAGGPVGGIIGAAAGSGVKRSVPVIDRALAADSAQLVARGVSRGGRALSAAVQDHINAGDTKAAIDQMGQEVYGE